jgi:hypothetical protein
MEERLKAEIVEVKKIADKMFEGASKSVREGKDDQMMSHHHPDCMQERVDVWEIVCNELVGQ